MTEPSTAEPSNAEPSNAEPSNAEPSTAEPPSTPHNEAEAPATTEGIPVLDEATVGGPTLEDGLLPCGLRVIIAQDATLPVAAVVLAIDTGTEDDPPSQPGLVHALAYHLLQGNRELTPAGAAALVHDRGGITSLAVGPAQVRYESLIPLSALSEVLWAESQRLRAPTVSAELWSSTLRWARRDPSLKWRAPAEAMAAAHGMPGLAHDGRQVPAALGQMVPRAIGQALAERFQYSAATLVVVSPHPPPRLRDAITEMFDTLPPATRHARDRMPRWRTGSVPQTLPLAKESGTRFVWPVAPHPAGLDQATVFCKAINRQRRRPGEPSRARLRCDLDEDPRRATMTLRASGVDDPLALLTMRIERLEQGEDESLVERQRQIVLRDRQQQLRSALPLARRLSAAGPRDRTEPGWRTRPVAALTGLAVLSVPWTSRTFGPHLRPGAAIHLVPSQGKPKAKPKDHPEVQP
ncbi:MAG: hypothetical protein AAGF11_27965 [Myxococcota bacterium]